MSPQPAVDPRFGQRMRAFRHQRGLSLRALERKVNSNRSSLSEYETGRTMPSATTARLIDEALAAGGTLAAMVSAQAPGAEPSNYAASFDIAAAADGMLRTFAFRIDTTHHAGQVTPETAEGLALVAQQYRRSYHAVPASQLLTAALAHLGLVVSLRPEDLPRQPRTTLITTAGEMAALAGVLLGLDVRHAETALKYFDLAWTAAREAADTELQAVVMACRSFALAYGRDDHTAGLDCADFAREIAKNGTSRETRGWVAAVASERAASLGDLTGCRARLDESREVLQQVDDQPAPWRGIGGFNGDKLRAYEGGDMVRLHRFTDAVTILDEAVDRLDDTLHRHRATALIDRAEAQCGLGAIDAACGDAAEALRLVAQVQHMGNLARIEKIADVGAAARAGCARVLRHEIRLVKADYGLPVRWGSA